MDLVHAALVIRVCGLEVVRGVRLGTTVDAIHATSKHVCLRVKVQRTAVDSAAEYWVYTAGMFRVMIGSRKEICRRTVCATRNNVRASFLGVKNSVRIVR